MIRLVLAVILVVGVTQALYLSKNNDSEKDVQHADAAENTEKWREFLETMKEDSAEVKKSVENTLEKEDQIEGMIKKMETDGEETKDEEAEEEDLKSLDEKRG